MLRLIEGSVYNNPGGFLFLLLNENNGFVCK